jgi:hypothetical protein
MAAGLAFQAREPPKLTSYANLVTFWIFMSTAVNDDAGLKHSPRK